LPILDWRVLDPGGREQVLPAAHDDREVLQDNVLTSIEQEHRAILGPSPAQLGCQRALPAKGETADVRNSERLINLENSFRQRDLAMLANPM
jgi:hypothetical protein